MLEKVAKVYLTEDQVPRLSAHNCEPYYYPEEFNISGSSAEEVYAKLETGINQLLNESDASGEYERITVTSRTTDLVPQQVDNKFFGMYSIVLSPTATALQFVGWNDSDWI